MKKYIFITILLLIVFYACKENKRREDVAKVVNEWIGKEILFPENIPCYVSGKETLPEFCSEHSRKEFKILLYVDSMGCSNCRLKLSEWKQLMEEADSLFQGKLGFLLFFQPKSVKEMTHLFLLNKFDYPVFMDTKGIINDLNNFPQAMQYQCFLLDKNNSVMMIGNPVLNQRIWELYKEHLGEKNDEQDIKTTVRIDKFIHDYGTVQKGTSNPAVFTITNTGDNSLLIYRVSASCGCTNVSWNKHPVEAGQNATIHVEMKPEETGYFNKTVDVYCNAKESPVRLSVTGTTE